MFTRQDAENAGWTFATHDDRVVAQRGESSISISSAAPLFLLLANIAERSGVGFVIGYGGDQPITPELVTAVSGETYVTPPPPTPTDAQRQAANAATLDDRISQAIQTLEQAAAGWATLTAAQKDAALKLAVAAVARLARLQVRQLDEAP